MNPPAILMFRLCSQTLHSIMGGVAIFCLWYAAMVSDPGWLLLEALKYGGSASAIMYCQNRYLPK